MEGSLVALGIRAGAPFEGPLSSLPQIQYRQGVNEPCVYEENLGPGLTSSSPKVCTILRDSSSQVGVYCDLGQITPSLSSPYSYYFSNPFWGPYPLPLPLPVHVQQCFADRRGYAGISLVAVYNPHLDPPAL